MGMHGYLRALVRWETSSISKGRATDRGLAGRYDYVTAGLMDIGAPNGVNHTPTRHELTDYFREMIIPTRPTRTYLVLYIVRGASAHSQSLAILPNK